jgi:cytochrome P450
MNALLQPAAARTTHSRARLPGRPLIDAAFLRDPYPTYAALREAGPICWSDEFFGGAWLLTRHADVEAVLREDTHYSAQRTGGWVMDTGEGARAELRDFQRLFARAMLFVDGADHVRLRSVMNAGFRGDALERLRPFIESWIDARLEALDARAGASFDFMAEIARPLPAQVIAELMGIAPSDRDRFVVASEDLATFIGAPRPTLAMARSAQVSLLAMAEHFEALVALRRRAPGDDLVSRLVQAQAQGEVQGGAELLAQCAMLLFAGHETTRNLLGNGLQALLSHSEAWQALQQQPALLPGAIRELLRYDSPVQYTGRRVATERVLHGRTLQRGDLVVALIGAANRDPARYVQPERLDLTRRNVGALSFGAGPHVCIGAALTLMEAQVLFGRLLVRWPQLRLKDNEPQWNDNPLYRGLSALPVGCAGSA